MNERLHFFEEAADEIEEAPRWYRERSEMAERAFLHEVDRAVGAIVNAPDRGPICTSGTRRYIFPGFPYSIVYFIDNETIHVAAVLHDKRRPGYWRERLARQRS